MNTTTIERFPAHRLDEARQALEKAHARIVRAAARTGQLAPAAPELTVLAEHVESRCHDCKTTTEGFPPATHHCRGTLVDTSTDGAWNVAPPRGSRAHRRPPSARRLGLPGRD